MEWLLPLIGGLGIGSFLTKVTDHFLNRQSRTRDRLYQEKREAYLGLLDALHRAAVQPSNENSKAYALWQTRVQLFGSPEAAKAAQGIVDTNTGPRDLREQEFKALLDAIRRDLHF